MRVGLERNDRCEGISEENGSRFARLPTHVAIRLRHEWGTRFYWLTGHHAEEEGLLGDGFGFVCQFGHLVVVEWGELAG